MAQLAGLVLAAGAGSRMGMPKALIADDDGPWVVQAATHLRDAGAERIFVALGAQAQRAAGLVPKWAGNIVIRQWQEGMGASLRESLTALGKNPAAYGAVVVTLVDLPGTKLDATRRVVGKHWDTASLRRATYEGQPGHPVLIGRDHWTKLAATLTGDAGARRYLEAHGAKEVDCSDLGGGDDIDSFHTATSIRAADGPMTKNVPSIDRESRKLG